MHKILFFLSLVLSGGAFAKPVLHVGDMFESMHADQSGFVKRINNRGASTAYVRVDIAEMTAGGEELQDASAAADGARNGLIASPSRLVIPAEGTYSPRLIMLGARDHERYFRVRFIPVLPTRAQGFAIDDKEGETYADKLSAEMSVLVGYGTWVTVAPKAELFNTRFEETADAYEIRNDGNTSVHLRNVLLCTAQDKCESPFQMFLTPGSVKQLKKEAGAYYRFNLREARKEKPMRLGS